jgi:GTP-binding protein Era
MTTRCGFVAIVGAPNAGKSTLLNRMTGAKLSIVSPKAQTTRFRVLGILMRGQSQVLLVDTPGIFKPKRRLDRAMVAAAWTGAEDADTILLLVDAKTGLTEAVREIAERLKARQAKQRVWLVLNKVDLVAPAQLLPLVAGLNALLPFAETYMVSATTGDGVEELQDALAAAVPEGPFLYPEDDLTESFQERQDGSVRIEATVYVSRPGHKAILIGAKGARIKDIGAKSRAQLAHLLERPVHLFLNVKERAGWDEEGARLRAIGLEDPH